MAGSRRNVDGNVQARQSFSAGLNQDFALEDEALPGSMLERQLSQESRGVQSEARLAVFDRLAGCPRDPKVRDAIGDVSAAGVFSLFGLPGADEERSRIMACRPEE